MPSKLFLRDHIRSALHHYFEDLEDASVSDFYQLVLTEVEIPLLEVVMHYAGTQSRASEWLGLNRVTLRKLLQKYALTSLKQTTRKSIV